MTSYYILQYSQPGVLGTSKNGVALVPTTTDDENSWEQNIAYTYNQLTFHHSQTTATDMDSTAADAAKMVKNAYLIFSDGKRVVVPPDQIQYFDAVMQNTKPLWDEYALFWLFEKAHQVAAKLGLKAQDFETFAEQAAYKLMDKMEKGEEKLSLGWMSVDEVERRMLVGGIGKRTLKLRY